MKVIKNCESYLDVLFTEQDIQDIGGSILIAGAVLVSALDELAYNQGIDLSDYTDGDRMVVQFENFLIVRVSYTIKYYSPDIILAEQEFYETARQYAEQYRAGTLKFQGEHRQMKEKAADNTYMLLTAANISQFRPVLSHFRQNAKASLYTHKGKYHLIYKSNSFKGNETILKEFVDARHITYIQLGVIEESAKCIANGNAVKVIKNFY